MKLILYTGDLDKGKDPFILGDAKVKEVMEKYPLARLLEGLGDAGIYGAPMNWGVITR